ncbi:MAG: hypothetical protein KJN76_06455 [Eudoraea sp.]|nr:hypothetical protein [Eudoraea sp.]
MIYLDVNSDKIISAKTAHSEFMQCRVNRKLGYECQKDHCEICMATKPLNPMKYIFKEGVESVNLYEKLVNFLSRRQRIKKIIEGEPKELLRLNNLTFKSILSEKSNKKLEEYFKAKSPQKKAIEFNEINLLVKCIGAIFDYKWFIGQDLNKSYSAYKLAENLSIRSCTYCNRTYTTTIRARDNGKLMRPQFDHWFPKSKYPLLALSFYNLIPSCYTCNSSVKGDMELNLNDHIHPYVDKTQSSEFSFSYLYNSSMNSYSIRIKHDKRNSKAFNTLNKLKIDQMYEAHLEELKDLIKIKQSYSDSYIDKIKGMFKKNELSKREIYRLLFSTEMNIADFDKRPLSKFKSDILKELGIL